MKAASLRVSLLGDQKGSVLRPERVHHNGNAGQIKDSHKIWPGRVRREGEGCVYTAESGSSIFSKTGSVVFAMHLNLEYPRRVERASLNFETTAWGSPELWAFLWLFLYVVFVFFGESENDVKYSLRKRPVMYPKWQSSAKCSPVGVTSTMMKLEALGERCGFIEWWNAFWRGEYGPDARLDYLLSNTGTYSGRKLLGCISAFTFKIG